MDLGIIFNVNEEWSLRKHPPCRLSFKIECSSANESLEGSWMSLRLWRRGGLGHPEAEAATHSPNPLFWEEGVRVHIFPRNMHV